MICSHCSKSISHVWHVGIIIQRAAFVCTLVLRVSFHCCPLLQLNWPWYDSQVSIQVCNQNFVCVYAYDRCASPCRSSKCWEKCWDVGINYIPISKLMKATCSEDTGPSICHSQSTACPYAYIAEQPTSLGYTSILATIYFTLVEFNFTEYGEISKWCGMFGRKLPKIH